jgi:hypothetical protein
MEDEEEMEGIEDGAHSYSGHLMDDEEDFKTIIANWILKMKECSKLTQATMEAVIQGVILTRVNSAVMAALTKVGIDPTTCPELHSIFDPNGKYGRPFKDLDTSYQHLQYCRKYLRYVVCKHLC